MANMKRGDKLVCVPCGREISVSCAGVSDATIWCCDKPMEKKKKTARKK